MLDVPIPEWIRATAAWRWFWWNGMDVIPTWNHGVSFFLAIALAPLARRVDSLWRNMPGKARPAPSSPRRPFEWPDPGEPARPPSGLWILPTPLLLAGQFWWMQSTMWLDGGGHFARWSGGWAAITLVVAASLLVARRCLAQQAAGPR